MGRGRGEALAVVTLLFLMFAPGAYALSMSFSDKDHLGGASWGTMTIEVLDADTLTVRYDAAPDTAIPAGSQVTAFGFVFDATPVGVRNPGAGDFLGDQDDLNWVKLNNLNAIPNPANGDEFSPEITKFDYTFGATEGNANNITPPGILPGEFDEFYVDFAGIDLGLVNLEEFVYLTGIRLQSLPLEINGGSLFLAGRGDDGGSPVPEPGTMLLMGSGLVGLAAMRRRAKA